MHFWQLPALNSHKEFSEVKEMLKVIIINDFINWSGLSKGAVVNKHLKSVLTPSGLQSQQSTMH